MRPNRGKRLPLTPRQLAAKGKAAIRGQRLADVERRLHLVEVERSRRAVHAAALAAVIRPPTRVDIAAALTDTPDPDDPTMYEMWR